MNLYQFKTHSSRAVRRTAAYLKITLHLFGGVAFLWTSTVQANPVGEQVVAGAAGFERVGGALTITQGTDRAVINWNSFSIGAGEITKFVQPNSSSAVLNRVITANNPSAIYGTLQANGQVYLINPAGIFIGPGGLVDTASFVASTHDVGDKEFMGGGDLNFTGSSGASIINQGRIEAKQGDVFLVARQVSNEGQIMASDGTVGMISGTEVCLHSIGPNNYKVRLIDVANSAGVKKTDNGVADVVNAGVIEAANAELESTGNYLSLAIKNTGVIRATGVVPNADGTVTLTGGEGDILNTGVVAAIQKNIQGETVGGRILASAKNITTDPGSIMTAAGSEKGGEIRLAAKDTVYASGKVEAGSTAGKGGKVQVTGERVALIQAEVDVSGKTGGGTVLVGGDYLGKNPEVPNAKAVVMTSDSVIRANATENGDGGKVILWSDEYTGFYGEIFARGGIEGGNGGFVETSSKDNLQAFGMVTASAEHGQAGLWFLDPLNITITSSASANVAGSPNFTPAATGANILAGPTASAGSISAVLSAGTSVTVSTGNVSGSEAGNITVDATGAITRNGGSGTTTLTLNANGSVTIGAAISGTSGGNRLAVVLNAGSPNNGDTTTLQTAGVTINAAITTIGGDITINSQGSGGTTTSAAGILTTGATGNSAGRDSGKVTINQRGTGTVTLNGSIVTTTTSTASTSSTTSGNGGDAGGVTITTANGAITVGLITAVGGNGALSAAPNATFSGGAGGAISLTAGNSNLITLSGSTFNTTGGAVGTSTGTGTGSAGPGGTITLGSRVSLSGVTVTLTTGATAGNIAFNSTLDGAPALGLTSGTGSITFGGAVGSTTPLGAVTLNAASTVTASSTFRAASLTQAPASTGATSFQSITTTPSSPGAGGNVNLAGSSVAVTGLIDTRGNNTAGVGQAGGSVTITTSGTTSIGSINTSGGTALVSGVGGAGGDIDLFNATGSINFGEINTSGGGALSLDASPYVGGNAGGIIISSVVNRNITLNGNLTTSGGNGLGGGNGGRGTSLVFSDPVILGGASTMNTSGGTGSTAGANGNVYFNNTLNGSGALTITISTAPAGGIKNGGDILFAAPVGESAPLGAVIINNSAALGTVEVGSGSALSTSFKAASLNLISSLVTLFATTVQTSGLVTLNSTPLILNGSTSGNLTTIDTTNGGAVAAGANITVNGAVNGTTANTQSLTLNSGTGGVITFGSSVGTTVLPLSALTITQSGGATFSGAVSAATVTITDTTDAQTVAFQGNLNATTGMTVAANGAYNVSITGAANTIAGTTTFGNTGTVTLGNGGDTIGFTGGVVATAPSGKNINGTITAAGTGVINLGTTGVNVGGTSLVGGTSTGAITLGNATIVNAATLTVGTGIANAITFGTVASGGAGSGLTLNTTGTVTASTVSLGTGTLLITQSSGTTFSGAVSAGAAQMNSAGDISAINSGNRFSGQVVIGSSQNTALYLNALDDANLGSVVANQNFTLVSNDALALNGIAGVGSLSSTQISGFSVGRLILNTGSILIPVAFNYSNIQNLSLITSAGVIDATGVLTVPNLTLQSSGQTSLSGGNKINNIESIVTGAGLALVNSQNLSLNGTVQSVGNNVITVAGQLVNNTGSSTPFAGTTGSTTLRMLSPFVGGSLSPVAGFSGFTPGYNGVNPGAQNSIIYSVSPLTMFAPSGTVIAGVDLSGTQTGGGQLNTFFTGSNDLNWIVSDFEELSQPKVRSAGLEYTIYPKRVESETRTLPDSTLSQLRQELGRPPTIDEINRREVSMRQSDQLRSGSILERSSLDSAEESNELQENAKTTTPLPTEGQVPQANQVPNKTASPDNRSPEPLPPVAASQVLPDDSFQPNADQRAAVSELLVKERANAEVGLAIPVARSR